MSLKGVQQGRLWALRNSSSSPIMHAIETGLPALFKTRKSADTFRRQLKTRYEVEVELVEVDVIMAACP